MWETSHRGTPLPSNYGCDLFRQIAGPDNLKSREPSSNITRFWRGRAQRFSVTCWASKHTRACLFFSRSVEDAEDFRDLTWSSQSVLRVVGLGSFGWTGAQGYNGCKFSERSAPSSPRGHMDATLLEPVLSMASRFSSKEFSEFSTGPSGGTSKDAALSAFFSSGGRRPSEAPSALGGASSEVTAGKDSRSCWRNARRDWSSSSSKVFRSMRTGVLG